MADPEETKIHWNEKFEWLFNLKKSTEDPYCSSDVRKDKHISKKILRDCSALFGGDEKDIDIDLIENEEELEVDLGTPPREFIHC